MSRILQTVLKHKLTISIAQIFSCRHQVCNVLQPLRNKILTLFTNSSNFLFRRILIMNRITTGKFQLGVQQNNKVSPTNQSHHFKYLLCFSRRERLDFSYRKSNRQLFLEYIAFYKYYCPSRHCLAHTMQGWHPPASPFLKPLFCGNSIFLLTLPNKLHQSAADENL